MENSLGNLKKKEVLWKQKENYKIDNQGNEVFSELSFFGFWGKL